MKDFLLQKYPEHSEIIDRSQIEFLYSHEEVHLTRVAYEKIERFIEEIFRYSRQESYQQLERPQNLKLHETSQASVLMSYDFHINSEGQPKLIEVNTNSSGFLIGSELYEAFSSSEFSGRRSALKQSFIDESQFFDRKIDQCFIVDSEPQKQKMYLEFLLYRNFLTTEIGWSTEILDIEALSDLHKNSFIYNRHTDFYFKNQNSLALKELYENGLSLVSPNPKEYFLLADKNRLLDWPVESFWSNLDIRPSSEFSEILLKTYHLQTAQDEFDVWKSRKKYFFKPLNLFGSKKTYRGSSLSRHKFNELILDQNMMIQEICQPSEIIDKNGAKWRYDLRFYVYRDQIQFGVARIYQGQLTNFKTMGGGFARIRVL